MQVFREKWWILSIILVIVCLIIIITAITNKKEEIGSAGISIEEYEKIKNGMTMTEVAEIINSENINNVLLEQISRLENSSGSTVYKYKYIGENKGYAIITYEYTMENLWSGSGMKVILKEQFNLK